VEVAEIQWLEAAGVRSEV
jgi:hypothetical protein